MEQNVQLKKKLNTLLMNKRIIMKRLLMLVVISSFLVSCKDKEKDKLYDELKAGYKTSNEILEDNIIRAYTSLRLKTEKPESREAALFWFTKAEVIKKMSDSLFESIDSLILKIKDNSKKESIITEQKSGVLYKNLLDYKQQVLSIDPEFMSTFKDSLTITAHTNDAIEKTENVFYEDYFLQNGNDVIKQIVHLTKIENNIRFLESTLIVFMSRKICVLNCDYSLNHAIIYQNTFHLKKNEVLEVNAGIGVYRTATNAHVIVHNKVFPVKGEGFAVYKQTITDTPGKYKFPLRIEYKNPDGSTAYYVTEIEYTVDE